MIFNAFGVGGEGRRVVQRAVGQAGKSAGIAQRVKRAGVRVADALEQDRA
jgi:hypothetical protein